MIELLGDTDFEFDVNPNGNWFPFSLHANWFNSLPHPIAHSVVEHRSHDVLSEILSSSNDDLGRIFSHYEFNTSKTHSALCFKARDKFDLTLQPKLSHHPSTPSLVLLTTKNSSLCSPAQHKSTSSKISTISHSPTWHTYFWLHTDVQHSLDLQIHNGSQFLVAVFPVAILDTLLPDDITINHILSASFQSESYFELHCIFQSLFNATHHSRFNKILLSNQILTFTLMIFRQLVKERDSSDHVFSERPISNDDRERIAQARHIIHSQYHNPPTLIQLARIIGINKNKLCKGFKQLYGMTVSNYIRHYRLEIARDLLNSHQYNIAQVAEVVGYDHPGNFTAAYKRQYGELPKSLRRTM